MSFILYFLLMAGTMLLLSKVLPGFEVRGWGAALLAAFVLGLLNAIVKPILFVLTLPLTIVTLGLFLLVLNAIVLGLTAWLVPGFAIPGGFGTTFLAALVLSVMGMVWKGFVKSH
jgi:putative membrane protein